LGGRLDAPQGWMKIIWQGLHFLDSIIGLPALRRPWVALRMSPSPQFPPDPSRGRSTVLFAVTLALSVAALCSRPAAAQGSGQAVASGVTQAVQELKLSMTAAGRVESLLVREGDRVAAGQLVLHLDRALENLEVKRRRLLLEDRARITELRERELVLQSQVEQLRPLLASGGVARKQVEDEELALRAVVAERRALEAAKQREEVELELALEAFERRHLRSPINGIVTRILHRTGESVAPNEPVIHVVDVARVRFLGTIPAAAGVRLRAGSAVTVRLGPEDGGRARPARVVFVSPVTDPSSGLVEVVAEFENADGSVRPGVAGRMQY
jgi:RND family efflux transporter MFP subunit